jgi:hypothetical protein
MRLDGKRPMWLREGLATPLTLDAVGSPPSFFSPRRYYAIIALWADVATTFLPKGWGTELDGKNSSRIFLSEKATTCIFQNTPLMVSRRSFLGPCLRHRYRLFDRSPLTKPFSSVALRSVTEAKASLGCKGCVGLEGLRPLIW